jgi:prevent-host-death family protein
MDHMRKTSLVHAKAHLSELVDAAEHRGQRVIILRHGRPAAAIVPVELAQRRSQRRVMTQSEAEAFLDEVATAVPVSSMTAEEALGRSRLDRI